MKSLDENAKASMVVRHNPSSKKVIFTTNHVGPYIPAQNGNRLLEPTDCWESQKKQSLTKVD